jgi:3-oxoacyl-[acyl-carrier-protein] synthase III
MILKKAKFLGVGSYVPPQTIKNQDLTKWMDTSDEWIQERTGIKQRHWVEGNTTTSDLGLIAAERALENAKVNKSELDMIIFATLSPDHEFPGTACFLQAKLGVPGIPAIDVRQQCSGFLYGVSIADQFIKTGAVKKVLVIGAEVHSKAMDKTNEGREVSVLFGDGAGAVVIGVCDDGLTESDSQIFSTHLHADGSFAKELWVEAPTMTTSDGRINQGMIDQKLHYPKMNGKTVFVHASRRMPEAVLEALEKNGKKIEDVDLFIFHQANLRINQMVAKQLGIPEEKVFNTIQDFGNTTAATIPIGLNEAVKAGKLKKGMLVASAAFGSGFTWSSALFRW